MHSVAHCRRMAEDLEATAETVSVLADRELLLDQAKRWRELLRSAEIEERRRRTARGR